MCGVLVAGWERVPLQNVFGYTQEVKCLWVDSCRRGRFLCVLVQRFAIVVFINSFASPNLPELWWPFILVATEKVVGILEAAGEGKVFLVPVVSIMIHFFLVIRQYIRHAV